MNQREITPSAVREEVGGWISYLNEIVGVLCFNLALAVVSTENPSFYGALAFMFITLFHIPNFKKKAKILTYLRNKKNRDSFEEQALNDLLSQIQFSKLGLSILGYVLLFFVTAGPVLFQGDPIILEFMYGK